MMEIEVKNLYSLGKFQGDRFLPLYVSVLGLFDYKIGRIRCRCNERVDLFILMNVGKVRLNFNCRPLLFMN